MMGLAASLDQKFEGAIKHFIKCSQLMASQIARHSVGLVTWWYDLVSVIVPRGECHSKGCNLAWSPHI